MTIDLSNEEILLIEEMLKKELQKLPVEIHHTFSHDFKDYLKEKQKKIDTLLKRIESLK